MEWAYAVIAAHALDPLGGMIVLHLGWRDKPDQRSDRGIAAALGQHRSSVRLATAKLERLGVLVRAGREWKAAFAASVPVDSTGQSVAHCDADNSVDSTGQSVAHDGPVSGPLKGQSVAHKRKRIFEKGKPGVFAPPPRRLPRNRGDVSKALPGVASLSSFVRDRLLCGQSVQIGGVPVLPGSPEAEKLVSALRAESC